MTDPEEVLTIDQPNENVEAQDAIDAPSLTEMEQLAADLGWKPESEWKGDKAEYRGAADFLKHQAHRAKTSSKEVKQLTERMDKVAKTQDRIWEARLREERAELEDRLSAAVAANKPGEAHKLSRAIDQLDRENSDTSDPAADFKERNAAWYGVDEDASAYAYGIAQKEATKGKSPAEQLEAVEAAVKRRFPELFGEPRKTPPVVGAPTSRSTPARSKTFTLETLPPEAKAAMKDQQRKWGLDPKRYLAAYNEENAG